MPNPLTMYSVGPGSPRLLLMDVSRVVQSVRPGLHSVQSRFSKVKHGVSYYLLLIIGRTLDRSKLQSGKRLMFLFIGCLRCQQMQIPVRVLAILGPSILAKR
jgi:hypothetical protein